MVVLKSVVDHVPKLLEHLVCSAVPALEPPPEPCAACFVQRTEQDSYALAFHALYLGRDEVDVVDNGLVLLGSGSYRVDLTEVGDLAGVECVAAIGIVDVLGDVPVPCERAQSAGFLRPLDSLVDHVVAVVASGAEDEVVALHRGEVVSRIVEHQILVAFVAHHLLAGDDLLAVYAAEVVPHLHGLFVGLGVLGDRLCGVDLPGFEVCLHCLVIGLVGECGVHVDIALAVERDGI